MACKAEKHLPAGVSLIRLVQVGPTGEFPELSMYYLPVACQQCAEPACAAACPEDAIVATPQGIVAVDPALCTACGDCLEACPYGAIVLGHGDRVARKCDLCAELLAVGKQPACVAVCPGKALTVIEAEDVQGAAPDRGARDHGARRPGRGRHCRAAHTQGRSRHRAGRPVPSHSPTMEG